MAATAVGNRDDRWLHRGPLFGNQCHDRCGTRTIIASQPLGQGAPVPRIGPRPAVWADSHNLCLRQGMDERRLRAAWRFVKYLSDHSLDWAEGGQVPVRRSLRDTERFRKMKVQAAFARQIADVRYLPSLPFVFEFETELGIAVDRAVRGSASPEEALRTAAANVNRVIARRRAAGAAP